MLPVGPGAGAGRAGARDASDRRATGMLARFGPEAHLHSADGLRERAGVCLRLPGDRTRRGADASLGPSHARTRARATLRATSVIRRRSRSGIS